MRTLCVFLFVCLWSCSSGQELLGPIELKDLKKAPHNEWFDTEYTNYNPFAKTLDQIQPLLKDVEIEVFMGTWCGDSQLQVPAFFRILDELEFKGKTTLIAVDEDKKTPSGSAAAKGITNVPTFIFYKNGTEIHRIVESPIDFLEDDMLAILSGAAYKHTYED